VVGGGGGGKSRGPWKKRPRELAEHHVEKMDEGGKGEKAQTMVSIEAANLGGVGNKRNPLDKTTREVENRDPISEDDAQRGRPGHCLWEEGEQGEK